MIAAEPYVQESPKISTRGSSGSASGAGVTAAGAPVPSSVATTALGGADHGRKAATAHTAAIASAATARVQKPHARRSAVGAVVGGVTLRG